MPYFDLGVETRLFFTDDPAENGAGENGVGERPPLLLIHGWCCDSHDWNYQIPDFVSQHRVIAVDLRGHGRSSGSKGLRPRVLAADIAALLHQLGVTPRTGGAVAVGHSLGALVASALAVEDPGLVRAVVAIEPAYGVTDTDAARSEESLGDLGAPGTQERLLRYLQALAGPEAPAHLTTWHRRRALAVPAAVARAALFGMWLDADQFGRRDQSTDYLGRRTCPVLAVYSERQAERAAWERGVVTGPLDEVRQLPGGHWLHQERPEEFNALVLDWIARLSSADLSSQPRPGVSFL